ncbi:MAG: zinc ribbon domain-containing protein [Anaerolineae bacterium]|nr:zinc ribbon domain-containing protein [Anaerolineae bacterium]
MRCEECNKVIPDNAAYCAYCGAKAAAGGLHAPVFRFNLSGDKAVTLKDLTYALDRNWGAARVHLYAGDFANWLGSMGRGVLADQVREITRSYSDNPDLGLELFTRLIGDAANADIPPARPALDPERIDFGRVPRDNHAETTLTITNAETRGYLAGRVRVPPGVTWLTLSAHEFAGPRTQITLRASTRDLPAGSQHRTRLIFVTPFDTTETTASLYVATEWSTLLRALIGWVLGGAVALLAMAAAALLLRELEAAAGGLPWTFLYLGLAALVALVVFGSIRTQDTALAIVLSILIGGLVLLPIGLGVLALSFVLAIIGHQTAAIALTVDSTPLALALMAGVGALVGGLVGLYTGLRRLRRAPAGLLLAAALLAMALLGLARLAPVVSFGVFRPANQPLLVDIQVPVPYLAFAATLPAPGMDATLTAVAPSATPAPTPTLARRLVSDVGMLWEVAPVTNPGGELPPAGVVDLAAGIDPAGRVHIAYIAQPDAARNVTLLYYAWLEGGDAGGAWQAVMVTTGEALAGVALALDADGRPYIAYTAQSDNPAQITLHLATQAAEDAGWTVETVDGPGLVGAPAPAFDAAGRLALAYPGGAGQGLKLARPREAAAPDVPEVLADETGGWDVELIDETEGVGGCPALAFDRDGVPHVAYVDETNAALRYARYLPAAAIPTVTPAATPTPGILETLETGTETEAWYIETISAPDRRISCDLALALDEQTGARHVLFYDAQAEHIYEALYLPTAARWRFNRLDAARPPGPADGVRAPLSLALDRRGRLLMTYNGPASLRFAREVEGNILQSGVIDGPSPAQQVLLSGALRSYVVYVFQGDIWYATLLQAPEAPALAATPTLGPSPTPYLTPTPSPVPVCGDGVCQPGGAEDFQTCPGDCAGEDWVCGNEICEEFAEDARTCPADCTGPFDETR